MLFWILTITMSVLIILLISRKPFAIACGNNKKELSPTSLNNELLLIMVD